MDNAVLVSLRIAMSACDNDFLEEIARAAQGCCFLH